MFFSSTRIHLAHDFLRRTIRYLCLLAALIAVPTFAWADNNTFDLLGPRIEMKVTRHGKPLPISDVANLQPGDRLRTVSGTDVLVLKVRWNVGDAVQLVYGLLFRRP